jgi:hypothetical protein
MGGPGSGRRGKGASFTYGGKQVTTKSVRAKAINKMPAISKSKIEELKKAGHAVSVKKNGMVVVDGFKKYKGN